MPPAALPFLSLYDPARSRVEIKADFRFCSLRSRRRPGRQLLPTALRPFIFPSPPPPTCISPPPPAPTAHPPARSEASAWPAPLPDFRERGASVDSREGWDAADSGNPLSRDREEVQGAWQFRGSLKSRAGRRQGKGRTRGRSSVLELSQSPTARLTWAASS